MIKTSKLTGAGNTFLIIDLRSGPKASSTSMRSSLRRRKIAKELCDPHHSIGADGLLFLEKSRDTDLRWDFYNADGSGAEMCGNAARCVGLYTLAHPVGIKKYPIRIRTGAGIIEVTPHHHTGQALKPIQTLEVDVKMPSTGTIKWAQTVRVGNKIYTYDAIHTGVPHAVFRSDTRTKLLRSARENVDKFVEIVNCVRSLPTFRPVGVNVTFFEPRGRNSIDSLTFERGVTGYTQACGTGAVAAAIGFLKGALGHIQVRVPGGCLQVTIAGTNPILTGPAKYISDCTISPMKLHKLSLQKIK
jgi:diaminopimelate epimerase